MSHIVEVKSKVRDAAAIAAACSRLGWPAPVDGTVELYSGEAKGTLVQLPGWQYPAVIDTQSGTLRYDNFGGQWGDPDQLDRFLQAYAVEAAKQEARKMGYAVSEQALQDGSIKLQISERA